MAAPGQKKTFTLAELALIAEEIADTYVFGKQGHWSPTSEEKDFFAQLIATIALPMTKEGPVDLDDHIESLPSHSNAERLLALAGKFNVKFRSEVQSYTVQPSLQEFNKLPTQVILRKGGAVGFVVPTVEELGDNLLLSATGATKSGGTTYLDYNFGERGMDVLAFAKLFGYTTDQFSWGINVGAVLVRLAQMTACVASGIEPSKLDEMETSLGEKFPTEERPFKAQTIRDNTLNGTMFLIASHFTIKHAAPFVEVKLTESQNEKFFADLKAEMPEV